MAARIWHKGAETIRCIRKWEKTSESMTVTTRQKTGNCLCMREKKRETEREGRRPRVCETEIEGCSYLPKKPRVR